MYYPNEFKELINNGNLDALEALCKDADLSRQCWAKAAYADVRGKMVLETGGGDRRILLNNFILYGEVLEAKLPDDVPGKDVLIQHCQLKQAELMLVRHPRIDASFTKERAHTSLKDILQKTVNAEIKQGAAYLVARILLEGGQTVPRNLISAMNLLDSLTKAAGVTPQLKTKAGQLMAFHRGIANEYAQMMRAVPPSAPPNIPPVPKLVPGTNLPPHMRYASGAALAEQIRAQQQAFRPPVSPVAPLFMIAAQSALPGAQPQMRQLPIPLPPTQAYFMARSALPGAQLPQPSVPPSVAPPAAANAVKRKTPEEQKTNQASTNSSAKPAASTSTTTSGVSTAPSTKADAKKAKKQDSPDAQLQTPASSTAGMMQTIGHATPVAPPAKPPAAVVATNVPAAAGEPRNTYNTATAEDDRLGALALAALAEFGEEQEPKGPGM